MKIQATVLGLLIGVTTTFAGAEPVPSGADAATSGWASVQPAGGTSPSTTAAPVAAQQPGSGTLTVQSGDTSESDNTPRLVLLALLAMGSIALRRSGSAQ